MDNNLGTKWSRNLSEESVRQSDRPSDRQSDSHTDSNRLRLIERQRQLLETKFQRQQQVIATTTRPSTARSVKSALSGRRSSEKLIDLEESNAGGLVNAGLSPDGEWSSPEAQKSPPSKPSFETNIESGQSVIGIQNQSQTQTHKQSVQTLSSITSSENSNFYSKTQLDNKSLQMNKTDKNLIQKINLSLDKSVMLEETTQVNPLSTILTNEELLLFATQPISPQTTLQCTIIRDKKGLDRSLYPTYYMHLQAIVPNTEPDKTPSDKTSEPSSPKSRKNSVELVNVGQDSPPGPKPVSDSLQPNGGGNRPPQSSGGYRQVFLLSGRRRKKSKTYIIGNDPFDISRGNCIAKLKSNVLGTQFTAIRIGANGRRQEIASIIYETNVLGFKGPRRMTALIPKYDQMNVLANASVFEEWKRNNRAIIQLKNKTPIWNDETQSYVLNFKGRVTQASVKNFQLVTCQEREDIQLSSPTNQSDVSKQKEFAPTIPTTQPLGESVSSELVSMQFGRVSASQFSCDVSWPMSLLQAFAIALSSFDSKLACE